MCTAVQSLLNYQCDMALAGGVSITLPQKRGYLYQEGGITSPDGHCRTFDEDAAGTVFGNGVGIVALRRLSDALEDGDTIYAVIKGAGMNNDGAAKVSFTAPSVDGHAGVIALAQALAGIDPETISYVEAHGTATPLGDPIEIAGLTQAFRAGGATGTGYLRDRLGQEQRRPSRRRRRGRGAHQDGPRPAPQGDPPEPPLHRAEPEARSRGHTVPGRHLPATVAVPRGFAAPRRRQLVRRRRDERPRGAGGGSCAPARPAPTTTSS